MIESQGASPNAEDRTILGERAPLSMLQLSDWEEGRHYNRSRPVCIHYDIQWKVSQNDGQNHRANRIWRKSEPNLVLAPGDLWSKSLKGKVDDFVRENLGENAYRLEGAIVFILIKNSRGHGFRAEYHEESIEWRDVDDHLAGPGGLFKKGRGTTTDSDLAYQEIVCETYLSRRNANERPLAGW